MPCSGGRKCPPVGAASVKRCLITGTVSPRAQAALEERGWEAHAWANTELGEKLASG